MRSGSLLRGIAARPRSFVMVAFAALACAWGLSTVPFSGADEPSQYLRALAVSRGDIVMARAAQPLRATYHEQPVGILVPAAGHRTEALNTRVLSVERRMAPPRLFDHCIASGSKQPPGFCIEATYTGTYTPIGYILPAIGIRLARTATVGLWLGRLGAAIGCLGCLLLALALSARGGRWSVLGLVASASPTLLFMSSLLNADGLEIAVSIAFSCGCIRVAAERERVPDWVLGATGASGVVAILTWALGPLYVAVGLLLLFALLGRGGPTALVRARRRSVSICAGVLVAATGAYVAWSMAMGRTHAGLELSPLLPSLSDAWHQLSLVWEQAVGVVSWINVYLPASLYREYLLTALILLTLALRFGEGRERLMLVGTTAAALLAPVLLNQWLLRPPSDQGVQGRYVLPLLALVPLLSGHVLSRNAQKVGPFLRRWGPALIVCLIAFVEVAALIYVARFVTGGALPSFSIQHAQWAPPLGWGVWLLLTVLGGGSLALWGVSLLVPEPAESAIAARRSSPSA